MFRVQVFEATTFIVIDNHLMGASSGCIYLQRKDTFPFARNILVDSIRMIIISINVHWAEL